MTIDYKALAERIERIADDHESYASKGYLWTSENIAVQVENTCRRVATNLRTVVTLLNGMAEEAVVPFVHILPSDLERLKSETSAVVYSVPFSSPTERSVPLFTHPAPQPQPEVWRLVDALQSIRKHVADQPSALAKAIVATCDGALDSAPQPERQPVSVPTRWKVGNELAPYHPDASHVEPGYRDGWNACYRAMRECEPTEATEQMQSLVEHALRLQETHYGDGASLHIHMIAWAEKARAALAAKE